MKIRAKQILICTASAAIIVFAGLGAVYKWALPAIVNSPAAINFVQKQASKMLDADVKIQNPKLETGMVIEFNVDKFTIDKDGKNYLTLSDIETEFSLKKLYKRTIIVNKMLTKDIFVDAYNLSKIMPEQKKKKEKKSSFIGLDFYNTLLGVKNVDLIYHSPDFKIDLKTKHAIFDKQKKENIFTLILI